MTKIFALSLSVLCVTLSAFTMPVLASKAHAEDTVREKSAEAFIFKMSNEGLAFLGNNNLSMPQKKKRFKSLLDTHFDIKTIGQFALGIHWRNVSDKEKAEYIGLFEKMVVNVYARRFNEYQGQKFEVKSAYKRGKRDYIVSTQILPPEGKSGGKVSVDWRLRDKKGKFKVIDISVEGVSMIMTQRADFAAVIQKGKGDIEFLLTELRKSN